MRMGFSDHEIGLLNALIKFEEVDMKTIDNLIPIRGATVTVSRRGRGEDVKLPIWLAEHLIDRGKVIISDMMLKLLTQNIWRELAQPVSRMSIAKINPQFYIVVHIYNHLLRKGVIIGGRPIASRDDIRAVINKRREVIGKLSGTDLGILEDRLTFEEKILLRKMREIVREWDKSVGLE